MASADRQANKLLVHDNLYCLVFKLRALFQVLIESNLTVTKGSRHEIRLLQLILILRLTQATEKEDCRAFSCDEGREDLCVCVRVCVCVLNYE